MVNTSEIKNEKLKNNEATVQVMKQPKTFACLLYTSDAADD